jgi:type IV pilus assembly protein PilX
MNARRPHPRRRSCAVQRQHGAALLVSLIFLLLMSLIGVMAMQGATMQERMAGNTRDRHLAFQAAEAALREAEAFLDITAALPDFINAAGLYQSNAPNRPVWYGPVQAAGNGAINYTGNLGAELAAAPQYFIEELRDIIMPGSETETPPSPSSVTYYRVTARGVGGTQEAVVVLSTIYRRD